MRFLGDLASLIAEIAASSARGISSVRSQRGHKIFGFLKSGGIFIFRPQAHVKNANLFIARIKSPTSLTVFFDLGCLGGSAEALRLEIAWVSWRADGGMIDDEVFFTSEKAFW